jgi:hypothetical protein
MDAIREATPADALELPIRLSDPDRETLMAAATERGEGISTLVRELAEAERLRQREIRARIAEFVALTDTDPTLQSEVDATTTPDADDWPEYGGPIPERWLREAGLS